MCSPAPAVVRELNNIRLKAFGGPQPFRGFGFERDAIFYALSEVKDPEARRRILEEAYWNPLWPDADLSLDWSPVGESVLSGIESNEVRAVFDRGDKTLLHFVECEPAQGDRSINVTEAVAVMIAAGPLDAELDVDDLWELRSAFEAEPAAVTASVILRPQEPAIARVMPTLGTCGGDLTPALPSRRLIQLLEKDPTERLTWRDGREWRPWGSGPPLAQGTATLIESRMLEGIADYRFVWVVFRNWMPAYVVDPGRNQVTELSLEG